MTDKQQDEPIKDQIVELLEKGYTRRQLIGDFHFAERSVDAAIKEYKELKGNEGDEAKKGNNSEGKASALPAKLDIKQTIVPEYLIEHLSFVDGDRRQTFIDALLVYEAARRSVMEDVLILQGLAEGQSKMTETQLSILRAAKSESAEVADRAAQEAAVSVGAQVMQALEQQRAAPANPMQQLMVDMLRQPLSQLMAKVMGMSGQGMAGSIAPNQAGVQPPGQNQTQFQFDFSSVPQPTKDELKEAFGEQL